MGKIETGPFIGLPFKRYGRDRAGLDCWGLVALVLRERGGVDVPLYTGDHSSQDRQAALEAGARDDNWMRIDQGHERPLDVARMEVPVRSSGRIVFSPCHVGVIVRRGIILDIEEGKESWIWRYGPNGSRYRIKDIWRHPRLA